MIEEVNKIEHYIETQALPQIIVRGEQLARIIDNFGQPTIELNTQRATFRIMGTYFYTVTIENFLDEPQSKCTCPYDKGGLCKHQVAALLYLKDYLKKNSHKIMVPPLQRSRDQRMLEKRNTSEPYLLKEYQPLSNQVIYDHTHPFPNYYSNNLEVLDFDHQDQTVHFDLFEASIFQKKSEKIYRVSFTKTDAGLSTVCTCNQETEKLCSHQITALWYILEELGRDFFAILNPNYVEQRFAEWADQTGIERELIRDYFDFDIQSRQFVPKPSAVGLVRFDEARIERLEQRLQPEALKHRSLGLPSSRVHNERAVVPGYVFSFEDPSVVQIIPITGVPTGTPWLKYITEYSSKNVPLQWEDSDEEITGIIKDMNQLRSETWRDNRNPLRETGIQFQQSYYKKLQRLFGLMAGKEYLYYRPAEHSGKIKRSHIFPLELSPQRAELFFELTEEEIFYTLECRLQLGEDIMNLSDPKVDRLAALPFFSLILHQDTLHLPHSLQQAYTLHQLKEEQMVFKCVKRDFPIFFEQIVQLLAKSYPVHLKPLRDMEQREVALQVQSKQLYITELSNLILFKPVIAYDHDLVINIKEQRSPLQREGNTIISYRRDAAVERDYLDFLRSLHPDFAKQRFGEYFHLPYTALNKNTWFFRVFEQFTERDIEVFGVNDLKNISYSPQ
ncbi:MAG: SWIM zinc finger family protein, partial [Bacteroidota bacterium]